MAVIPKSVQIDAMLHRRVGRLFEDYGLGPEAFVDAGHHLSVSRADVLAYLKDHPGEAEQYFATYGNQPDVHHAVLLESDGHSYTVSQSVHGERWFTESYTTLAEAVADHALSVYGRG
jgi:hypothetical protein